MIILKLRVSLMFKMTFIRVRSEVFKFRIMD